MSNEIENLKLKNKNLQVMVDASLARSGRIKKKAFELGFDPSKELDELEYLFHLLDQHIKK